ncbi:MAG: UPF0223 family protein [Gammaproteobacteria bacterium]|nr:UPF0223 family protein [Gammaproteobacteria bacterium]
MEYIYPVDYDTYNIKEVEIIIDFLTYLEDNYKKLDFKTFKEKYDLYRKTLNSKIEEKRIDREFFKMSGISIYKVSKELGL